MNQYKLKKSSFVTVLISILLVLSVLRFFSTIFMLTYEEMRSSLVIAFLITYGIVSLACIVLLIRMHRSRLLFNDNRIIYTPPFGAVRNLSYNDLQKLSIGGRSYVLYTIDGKKLVTFDDFRTENASEIVAFLKLKGVKTEI